MRADAGLIFRLGGWGVNFRSPSVRPDCVWEEHERAVNDGYDGYVGRWKLIISDGSHSAVHLPGCISINVICCSVTMISPYQTAGLQEKWVQKKIKTQVICMVEWPAVLDVLRDSSALQSSQWSQEVKDGEKLDTAAPVTKPPGVYLEMLRGNRRAWWEISSKPPVKMCRCQYSCP